MSGLVWFGCFGFCVVLFCFVFGCGVWELCVLVVLFCVGRYRWIASSGSRVSVVGWFCFLVLVLVFFFCSVLFFVGCCGNSVVGRILEVKDFWKDFLLGEKRGEERRE